MNFKKYMKEQGFKHSYVDKLFLSFIKKHAMTFRTTTDLQDMIWKIEDHYEKKIKK